MEYISKVKCTCCGELLTKPVLVNGLPYGSHCAKGLAGTKTSAKLSVALTVVAVVHTLKSYKMVRFNGKLYTLQSLFNDDVINFIINTKDSKCLLSQAIIQQATKNGQANESIESCLTKFIKSV